jgi:hypothetical protein
MAHAIAHARSAMFAERLNGVSVVKRVSAFLYGTTAYAIFLGTFLYAIGREASRIFSKERVEEIVGVVFIVASFFLTGWFYYTLYQALQSYKVL